MLSDLAIKARDQSFFFCLNPCSNGICSLINWDLTPQEQADLS